MNISLIQLEYLVALDKHRHFVKAAEASFVTQPTLSMQIKKLEESLGLKLFDRSKQPIIPTDAGELIIEQAKRVIQETARIEDIVHGYQNTVGGDIYIGVLPTISPYLMPFLIRNVTKHYPDLNLHVKELFTEDIVAMLKKDYLDVGILSTPLNDDSIIEHPLFYEKFKLYVHPDHPAYNKKALTTDDLLSDKIWLLSEGNCFRNQSLNLCSIKSDKKNANLDYESGSLETLKKIVNMEGGLTVLPEWASIELTESESRNIRDLEADKSVREISVVYTRNFAKARAVEALTEMINASVPEPIKSNKGDEVVDIM